MYDQTAASSLQTRAPINSETNLAPPTWVLITVIVGVLGLINCEVHMYTDGASNFHVQEKRYMCKEYA